MSRQNFSVSKVETRTRDSIGKYERHNERKNEHYGNMNVDLSRTPMNVHFKSCGDMTSTKPSISWSLMGRYRFVV